MLEVKYSKVIKRKDGRYSAYAWTEGGSRKYAYGKTSAECKRNLSEIIARLESGIVGRDMTFKAFTIKTLEARNITYSPTTLERYQYDLEHYIYPAIGDLKLTRIYQIHIQELLTSYGQTHAQKSSEAVKGLISAIFNQAIINRIISVNPCDGTQITKTAKYEYYIYSEDEIACLLNSLHNNIKIVVIALMAFCGLRPSEAMGLMWTDIDFINDCIHIHRTAVCIKSKVVIKEIAKTEESQSTIVMPQLCKEILLPFRKKFGYVYPRKDGGPSSARYFAKWFQSYIARIELPHTRFYDLRHFTATSLTEHGVQTKFIADYMRHTDRRTTEKYQHVRLQAREKAATAMDEIMSKIHINLKTNAK